MFRAGGTADQTSMSQQSLYTDRAESTTQNAKVAPPLSALFADTVRNLIVNEASTAAPLGHISREAAPECSPRRKPWVQKHSTSEPRRGRKKHRHSYCHLPTKRRLPPEPINPSESDRAAIKRTKSRKGRPTVPPPVHWRDKVQQECSVPEARLTRLR